MSIQRIAMPKAANQPRLGPSVPARSESTCSYVLIAGSRTAAVGTFGRCPDGSALVAMSRPLCPRRRSAGGRMVDLLRIDHRGERVELFEHMVSAPVSDELRDAPVRISRVAKRDRARRT